MSLEDLSVLLVSTDGALEVSLRRATEPLGAVIEVVANREQTLARLEDGKERRLVAVLDADSTSEDVIDTLRVIRRQAPHLPVVLTARSPDPALIVTALKAGATDLLENPRTADDWRAAILGALDRPAPQSAFADAALSLNGAFMGKSPKMAVIGSALRQIAWSDVPVLIQGETGSGKEVLARELHMHSPRAKKSFFKLNCAALPSELVESELFGYEKGAFTGAFQRKIGIFEAANEGTILLDEIGDMDVRLQAKLLQVLQDQAFQRIGGREPIKVDVRVIAATHRDLEAGIRDNKFREDLFYRLNVVSLVVPPLRERKDDLFDLLNVLLKKHSKQEAIPELTEDLRAAMLAWDWPGNVRELDNFARRLLVFRDCSYLSRELSQLAWNKNLRSAGSGADRIAPSPAAPPSQSRVPAGSLGAGEGVRFRNLAEVAHAQQKAEAETILAALNAAHWNRRTAAALLNVDYKGLLYRMKRLSLDRKKAETLPEPDAETAVAGTETSKVAAAVV